MLIYNLEWRLRFQAITSPDPDEAFLQQLLFGRIMFYNNGTLRQLATTENMLAVVEASPNPRESDLQYLRHQQEAWQQQLNLKLEDFLNMIGVFDVYNGFQSYGLYPIVTKTHLYFQDDLNFDMVLFLLTLDD